MIDNMYAIHDASAEAFLPPFTLPKDAMAQRAFSDCVNADDHQFSRAPDDYTLFKLGTFDNEHGLIQPLDAPLSLGNGVNFKAVMDPTAKEGNHNGQAITAEFPILPGTASPDSPE
jgi:hypothetical protein